LDRAAVEAWLTRYGRAWETMDPDGAVQLFTEDATYRETPFDEVMRGREAIRTYWAEIPEYHRDISFGSEVLAIQDDHAVARWWFWLTRVKTGVRSRTDGVFVLQFDRTSGLCRSLREWWHSDPPDAAGT
jgi:uncharacterized protein (TIGR02246 family)